MSDMKCPICQNNLHKINIIVSTCTNDKCKLWGSSIPNLVLDALAQAKQDLECTRKALGVATKYIKHTQKVSPFWFNRLANETLDKIKTALEQRATK